MEPQLYYRWNIATDELFEDVLLLPEEAQRMNEKLEAENSEFRWMLYGQSEEESVAA
jgi:hypothetical protein